MEIKPNIKKKHFEEQDSTILFKDGKRMSISTANRIKLLECFKRLNRDSFQAGFIPFTFQADDEMCFKKTLLNDITININNVGAVFDKGSYNQWVMHSTMNNAEIDKNETEIWFKEERGMISFPSEYLTEVERAICSGWLLFPETKPQYFIAGDMIQFIKKSLE